MSLIKQTLLELDQRAAINTKGVDLLFQEYEWIRSCQVENQFQQLTQQQQQKQQSSSVPVTATTVIETTHNLIPLIHTSSTPTTTDTTTDTPTTPTTTDTTTDTSGILIKNSSNPTSNVHQLSTLKFKMMMMNKHKNKKQQQMDTLLNVKQTQSQSHDSVQHEEEERNSSRSTSLQEEEEETLVALRAQHIQLKDQWKEKIQSYQSMWTINSPLECQNPFDKE
jgi:hypothetical protein